MFRFKEPLAGREGLVYAENGARRTRQASRAGPTAPRDPAVERFWLPEVMETAFNGPGRCEVVRHVPSTVKIPVVALSRPELGQWQTGRVFEWARPLFAAPMQLHLRFESNQHPAPQIFASEQEARDSRKKRRGRRS